MIPQPSFGAWVDSAGVHFRVWAPEVQQIDLHLEPPTGTLSTFPLAKGADGFFDAYIPGATAGDLYRYRVDGNGPFPDPASRFQPQGVHGPSQVIDPRPFVWTDGHWTCPPLADLVTYELHVGTFTTAGTFAAARERLPDLVNLGVNAIELMPLADFPGGRNWGYDGVALYAPPRCYGTPDELRQLVNRAHELGLTVLLDLVYNHLGPDGNYLGVYSKHYFTERHKNLWGAALNFDGPNSTTVRNFFVENALHWAHEYHFDGFRLDASHCIFDDSPEPILAEIVRRVRASLPQRRVLFIAEDHRNLAKMALPPEQGGWGFDGIWADDFHHQVRRHLAGHHESYYGDFTGNIDDLVTTIRQGWFYSGQHSAHAQAPRGTPADDLQYDAFIVCIQNHDQTGNRAFGERLHHQIEPAAWRAASTLLLCSPLSPLLWMGQEWAASSPFQFFTDHNAELGRLVTEGRRKEFEHFSDFTDPQNREKIPDPQAAATFQRSQLKWEERTRSPHAETLRLYKALLQLRRDEPSLRNSRRGDPLVEAVGDSGVVILRRSGQGAPLLLVCQLRGGATLELPDLGVTPSAVILHTEPAEFAVDPTPPAASNDWKRITFARPGAIVLRCR